MIEQEKMEETFKKRLCNMDDMKNFHSFNIMEPKFLECSSEEKSLTLVFPVLEWELNAFGSMQGGFITAAFDNAYGVLGYYITSYKKFTTIDINTSYQRPIYLCDKLKVKVSAKYIGNTIMNMSGEAFNNEDKLIAISSTNIFIFQDN